MCHAGYHRNRVSETIVRAKLTKLDQSLKNTHPTVSVLLSAEVHGKDCTILTQHLMMVAWFAYIPECRDILAMPPFFAKMLNKSKLELAQYHQKRLHFR